MLPSSEVVVFNIEPPKGKQEYGQNRNVIVRLTNGILSLMQNSVICPNMIKRLVEDVSFLWPQHNKTLFVIT